MARDQQILACSGVLYTPADWPAEWNGSQLGQAMQLCGVREPKVCLIATAVGDAKEYISAWLNIAEARDANATHLELLPSPTSWTCARTCSPRTSSSWPAGAW